jgi:hypothetical protein
MAMFKQKEWKQQIEIYFRNILVLRGYSAHVSSWLMFKNAKYQRGIYKAIIFFAVRLYLNTEVENLLDIKIAFLNKALKTMLWLAQISPLSHAVTDWSTIALLPS